jgi:general secretion pathway protein K
MSCTRRNQTGMALLLVLWVTMLLTVLVGSFVLLARGEALQARQLFESTRAQLAAEAGIPIAIAKVRELDEKTRWIADGRVYESEFDGAKLEVKIIDESGKIDINLADQPTLLNLMKSVGFNDRDGEARAAAIIDWRDQDELLTLNGAEDETYESEGFAYGSKDAPFDLVEELQQVIGFDYDTFLKLEPAITVYSARSGINAAFAPEAALLALPGMTPDLARQYVAQREQTRDPSQPMPALPDGTTPMAQGGGLTYSVESRATLDNGATAQIAVTLRMGNNSLNRPYRVVRWRDGSIAPSAAAEATPAPTDGGKPAAPTPTAPAPSPPANPSKADASRT